MVFAADYPFLEIVWTMLIFFVSLIWIWMVVGILADVFGRVDLSGSKKAAWVVFVVVVPFFGALSYLMTYSGAMAERLADKREGTPPSSAVPGGPAAEIAKAKQLLDDGALTQAEFEGLKARALA
jgi:hypothetical protein